MRGEGEPVERKSHCIELMCVCVQSLSSVVSARVRARVRASRSFVTSPYPLDTSSMALLMFVLPVRAKRE